MDIGHRVEQLWSNEQFGPWNLPLRHDGEVNLHEMHNKGHRPPEIEQQLVNLSGLLNSLDHGDLPLRNERDVDDLDGLQLRRLRSYLQSEHGQHSKCHCNCPFGP